MRSIWGDKRATVEVIARALAWEESTDVQAERYERCKSYQGKILTAIAEGAFGEGAVTLSTKPASSGLRLKYREPPIGIPLSHMEARKVVLENEEAAFRLMIEIPAARRWLENPNEPVQNKTNTLRAELPLRDRRLLLLLREWYRDEWVKDSKSQEWLRTQGRPPGATPSVVNDLIAAQEKFGKDVSREMIRNLRRKFAPDAWKRRGRKPKS